MPEHEKLDMWTVLPHASRYQYIVALIMACAAFGDGWVTYWPAFSQYTPPFRCRSVLDDSPFAENTTFDTIHNIVATDSTLAKGNEFGYNQCQV